MNQLNYIIDILNEVEANTELLELLEWDEKSLDRLLNTVSQIINKNNSTTLYSNISAKLKQKGYNVVVADCLIKYLKKATIKKETVYDC